MNSPRSWFHFPAQVSEQTKLFWEHLQALQPAKLVVCGYLSYIVVGWILLCLPLAQKGVGVGVIDNLFVTTSAISTTGLSPVSIADNYSFFGQCVILLLVQLGGIGYMTFGSFLVLASKTGLSPMRAKIGAAVFSLPSSFRLEKFIVSVIRFTFVIEMLGAGCLFVIFRHDGVEQPLWSAVFHSVSAFCTAGFGLYNDSFEGFKDDFWLNAVIAVLSYLGAVGFIVCVDFWRMFRGKVRAITLTSKIILWVTVWLTVCGTLLLFINEPSIRHFPVEQRWVAAFFQCTSAMTTVGFNTIPIGGLCKASVLLLIVLMVIGASPSGTGGGLKSTTFSAVLGVMNSAMRGRNEVTFWGKPIPLERIWVALASLGFYLLTLTAGIYLLLLTERSASFEQLCFEAASALGTVGLSMGITSSLTVIGKLIVIFLMFCGRVGPLTLGAAVFWASWAQIETQDTDLAVQA